ncbi:hypothetical protein MHBO_003969, partial [Bonamia ostreae]
CQFLSSIFIVTTKKQKEIEEINLADLKKLLQTSSILKIVGDISKLLSEFLKIAKDSNIFPSFKKYIFDEDFSFISYINSIKKNLKIFVTNAEKIAHLNSENYSFGKKEKKSITKFFSSAKNVIKINANFSTETILFVEKLKKLNSVDSSEQDCISNVFFGDNRNFEQKVKTSFRLEKKMERIYASYIMKRVERKLNFNGERNVNDFVDKLVKMASDEKRLSLMYEGWMPWI